MTEDVEKQVIQNTISIEVLKKTTDDTLSGVNKIHDTIDGIDKLLRGKDAENPGLVARVAMLENFSKRVKAAIASMITAIIAMAAAVLSWILGVFGTKGN
ncbi:MAG: hypothetical protein IH899_02325 [Planctomycetes bacterium]|nr:hypothetical protein [Planctomycetota bacterium]